MPVGVVWSGQANNSATIVWVTRFSTKKDEVPTEGTCTFTVEAGDSAETASTALLTAYNAANSDSDAYATPLVATIGFVPDAEEMTVDTITITDDGVPVGNSGLIASKTVLSEETPRSV